MKISIIILVLLTLSSTKSKHQSKVRKNNNQVECSLNSRNKNFNAPTSECYLNIKNVTKASEKLFSKTIFYERKGEIKVNFEFKIHLAADDKPLSVTTKACLKQNEKPLETKMKVAFSVFDTNQNKFVSKIKETLKGEEQSCYTYDSNLEANNKLVMKVLFS